MELRVNSIVCDLGSREGNILTMMESSMEEMLLKLGVFVTVQALVYLILSKSSNIFSKAHREKRSSFRIARSVSIQRILAALQDLPAGGELSPSSSTTTPMQSPTVNKFED
ncbi:hypothetical protein OIU84_025740 [Salix udensis]|uniref:Uncharacterized protein n=1 Tax=Salix udensis TaxID=889485 RepID=A0AAD6KKS3_9ROSI|nr:hypothetical protein OIU84_025740 [Salix udensis]